MAVYIKKILDAVAGTGESEKMSFSGNLLHKHNLSITTSTAGSALTISFIDKVTGKSLISHPATAGELSDKGFSITIDGYPVQMATVNVVTNTGAGDITVVYQGTDR